MTERSVNPLGVVAAVFVCVFLAGLPPPSAAARPRAVKPARILISPSGATLAPGASAQFTAAAFDRRGNPLPDVVFRWSSSNEAVLEVDPSGLVTAGAQAGQATITAAGGGKRGKIRVTVAHPPAPGDPATVAAGLFQVNGVLADDEWVYWTETDGRTNRVRRTRKAGGPIFDLAVEPSRDRNGLTVSYVHLQQIGGTLFWSRQSLGFDAHWTILSIPKEGGTPAVVLPTDAGVSPLLASGWRVSGRFVVAALLRPHLVQLSENTRVAAFDTADGTWRPLVTGRFAVGRARVLAAVDGAAFIRGETEERRTQILRLDPAAGPNSFELLHARDERDLLLSEPGAADGVNVYYWSQPGDSDTPRLFSLPAAGGAPAPLLTGSFGPGLAADGAHLFWARGTGSSRTLVRMPAAGGTPAPLLSQVFDLGALGGLALADTSIYVAAIQSRRSLRILQVER